jgi:hypothetical protein
MACSQYIVYREVHGREQPEPAGADQALRREDLLQHRQHQVGTFHHHHQLKL